LLSLSIVYISSWLFLLRIKKYTAYMNISTVS